MIKCMALKGLVTREECLACAQNLDNTCGYDLGLLSFIFGDRQERTGIHVTDLTGCLRKSYLDRTVEVNQYPHEMLMLSLGSITHGLLDTGSDIGNTEVRTKGLGVQGTIDRIHPVVMGESERIIDYKTTRWLTPSKLPYGSHTLQVNIYAALERSLGKKIHSAAIQYIDLSGPTKCRSCKQTVVPVPDGLACPVCDNRPKDAHLGAVMFEVELIPDNDIKELIEERSAILTLAYEMKAAPDPEPSFLCGYCKHVETCSDGKLWTGR